MNARVLSALAAAVCVLLGLSCLGLRYHVRQEAQQAQEDSLWLLTYDISFEATGPDAEMRAALPFSTQHCEVMQENFPPVYPGLRDAIKVLIPSRTRELWTSTRRAGTFDVTAGFVLRLSPRAETRRRPPLENLTADDRQRFLRDEENIPVLSESVRKVIQEAPDEAATRSERLQWIFDYCAHDIQPSSAEATDDAEVAMETRVGTAKAKSRAMVALCRAIKIPARIVTGFEIEQSQNLKPRVWVEVFQRQSWVPFDPMTGYARYLPMNFVPVRRGGERIVRDFGVSSLQERYAVAPLAPPETLLQAEVRHPLQILDLTRLPLSMHKVMKVLLLLPLGAFITSVIRNVIGIRTFGTFSPALLAMSFIYAEWTTGLAILIVVLTVGLFGRSLLEQLHLLMVPRLSIILTVVIICVVFGVSLLDYLALTPSAQAVLLPMVILTMLIERFHVSVEEDGLLFSIQLALGTMLVAALCYLALGWEDVGAFILVYPETHFFTIAVFILLGRYAGYRLTELWRFSDLVQTDDKASS